MLKIFNRLADVDIRQLMDVYAESIRIAGERDYPDKSENLQILFAEQDLFHYLQRYYNSQGIILAVWELEGRYAAVLRLERYSDGYLITALETRLEARGRGFAKALLLNTREWIKGNNPSNLYAHIDRGNLASIAVHRYCGFERMDITAIYLDGTVHPESDTYCYRMK